jgi:Ser/Thr protein kinase RdoA (MazF antagonist)
MIPVPQPVLEALAQSFGARSSDLSHFGGGHESSDGVVHAYPHQDGRRLLKIMALPAKDQSRGLFCLDERLKFMRFLGENGASIAFPRLSPQGNLYETHTLEQHLWVGYGMAIAPGKGVKEDVWDPAFFRRWGQMVGLLHRLTQQYPSWKSSVAPDSGQEFLTWREEWDVFHRWSQDEQVKQKWVEIQQQLEALPITRQVYGFIHNDPHVGNLLVDDGNNITLLDFDVANHHWFVTDISIACQGVLFTQTGGMDRPVYDREKLHRFLDSFLQGYARENQLPPGWLERLDLFIAYRRILLFTVMNDWISSKTEWRAGWMDMILSSSQVVSEFSA